ncbi:unnamed protein product [Closterium sp. Yama58-4]|nr:unnamed protein product [Closterium sp. Yama58-4]
MGGKNGKGSFAEVSWGQGVRGSGRPLAKTPAKPSYNRWSDSGTSAPTEDAYKEDRKITASELLVKALRESHVDPDDAYAAALSAVAAAVSAATAAAGAAAAAAAAAVSYSQPREAAAAAAAASTAAEAAAAAAAAALLAPRQSVARAVAAAAARMSEPGDINSPSCDQCSGGNSSGDHSGSGGGQNCSCQGAKESSSGGKDSNGEARQVKAAATHSSTSKQVRSDQTNQPQGSSNTGKGSEGKKIRPSMSLPSGKGFTVIAAKDAPWRLSRQNTAAAGKSALAAVAAQAVTAVTEGESTVGALPEGHSPVLPAEARTGQVVARPSSATPITRAASSLLSPATRSALASPSPRSRAMPRSPLSPLSPPWPISSTSSASALSASKPPPGGTVSTPTPGHSVPKSFSDRNLAPLSTSPNRSTGNLAPLSTARNHNRTLSLARSVPASPREPRSRDGRERGELEGVNSSEILIV